MLEEARTPHSGPKSPPPPTATTEIPAGGRPARVPAQPQSGEGNPAAFNERLLRGVSASGTSRGSRPRGHPVPALPGQGHPNVSSRGLDVPRDGASTSPCAAGSVLCHCNGTSSSSCRGETSGVSVHGHCCSSWGWPPLKRVWHLPPGTCPKPPISSLHRPPPFFLSEGSFLGEETSFTLHKQGGQWEGETPGFAHRASDLTAPHTHPTWGSPPLWVCWCRKSAEHMGKPFPHSAQTYGRSPVWMRRCWTRWELRRKLFPQKAQA